MPIRYEGKDWDYEALAQHIARAKGISIEKARAYVHGIEKNQHADKQAGVHRG